jgi:hypothetical protein
VKQVREVNQALIRLHWSTKVLSHEEKRLFLVYFRTLNSNNFPEFLYHPNLSFQVKGRESLRQDTKLCFTVGAIKNSRISSPRKMSCFAMMFVPLWKFLTMNITQISGACSLVRQRIYSTTERDSPLFLWLIAAYMKESYESMKLLLGKKRNDEFEWKLCGVLKVVAVLLGMQLGYTKFCCSLCE